jgi:histidinol-phosphate/aromatic aminotransferase/cobyric acid decarboxylase-like protein
MVENRDRLAGELRARGLRPMPSKANFILASVEPASAIEVNRALRELGVSVRPFPDLPEIGDAIRITVGPWELMEHFLLALDQLMTGGAGE